MNAHRKVVGMIKVQAPSGRKEKRGRLGKGVPRLVGGHLAGSRQEGRPAVVVGFEPVKLSGRPPPRGLYLIHD